ncbi:MAG: menaquinone biosynthesis protein [Saprospiraceae bacterium]|nr:menaquinone biosynthesis protein [Saprospiraceae bacterium]
MLRLASVKYLNSLPFSYALNKLEQKGLLQWERALPSRCASLLKENLVDIALLPVGALSDFDKLYGVTDYCIGSVSAVKTVRLFSQYKFEEIEQIVLSDASRTSNILVKILAEEYWAWKGVRFCKSETQQIQLKTAQLIIGDEVFVAEHQYNYSMDLGYEWNNFTGLPFVFAVWVSKNKLSAEMELCLRNAFKEGLDYLLNEENFEQFNIPKEILIPYFRQHISYHLDEDKKTAIDKFLHLAGFRNPLVN